MTGKDVMKQVIEFCDQVTRYYVSDLSDADLLVRSVPGSNHIAWQLGHMISGQCQMLQQLGYQPPALPPGFGEAHTKETSTSNDPAKFRKKAEYLKLMDVVKAAALAAVDATPDAKLDQPGPEAMREYAPTVASALTLQGLHWLMHSGQFVPIRRKLGKPPLF